MTTKDKDNQPPAPPPTGDEGVSANTPAEEPTHLTVVFAQDYRGVLTAEQYYTAGTRVEFPAAQAQALIAAGRATQAKSEK